MKKVLALVLAVAMILSLAVLAGCGQSTTETATANDAASSNKIVMATNAEFPPYEYYDGDTIVGIDAEIAKAIADDMGKELEIVSIEFDSIIAGVQTGKYDFAMAGLTVTEERLLSVDFSDSYATSKQVIVVPENSPIKSVDDLMAEGATYKVGVQIATTSDIYCTDDLGAERVTEYNTSMDAVTAMIGGKIDCVVVDSEPAKEFVASNEGLKILETEYVEEEYAACFQKGSELTAKYNESLKKLTADGTIQKIIDKYINSVNEHNLAAEAPVAE